MKKFKLKNKKEIYGRTLYQIQALKSFRDVKKNDFGGWIEKKENLSQKGNCWVYDSACIFGNARIFENAHISGDAKIYDNARIFGNAHISGNAKIYDNAFIYGDAHILGDAHISGNAYISKNIKIIKTTDYILYGPVGSRDSFLTIVKNQDYVATGCFYGTKKEFLRKVKKTHGNNEFAQQYKKIINFVFGGFV